VIDARQFEANLLRRWIAWTCLLLILVFSGLEATHAHSDLPSTSSTPCLICLSAHAKAPASTVQLLPVLFTVEALVTASAVQEISLAKLLALFTRPPPSCFSQFS
jgi:hypothetical protein